MVEDWLADNVARCPKCNEVIQIPPKGSPDGANAVILTTDEAADLLRRRADVGEKPAGPQDQPKEDKPSAPAAGRGPKTEPLPAALRQAAKAIHAAPQADGEDKPPAEGERHKTRPLPPMPAIPANPTPRMDSTPHVAPPPAGEPEEPAYEMDEEDDEPLSGPSRRPAMVGPVVSVAFILGLLIGAVAGWLIGHRQATTQSPMQTVQIDNGSGETDNGNGGQVDPVLPPPQQPQPQPQPTQPQPQPQQPQPQPQQPQPQPSQPQPQPAAPQENRAAYLTQLPAAMRVKLDRPPLITRQVAAISDKYPPNTFYYPAPPHQIYLEVKAQLLWVDESSPVTYKLGGKEAGVWLVTKSGKVYEPMGRPLAELKLDQDNPVVDEAATVTMDKSNPVTEIRVLFLVPEKLEATQVRFSQGPYANLTATALAGGDPTGGREVDGRWDAVMFQLFASEYPAEMKFMQALKTIERPHLLEIKVPGNTPMTLDIRKAAITGTIKPGAEKGYYDCDLTLGGEQRKATVRLFDQGRLLLLYVGDQRYMQCVYRRAENTFFGL